MPIFRGTWVKNCSKASSPPAEAPIPTMGNASSFLDSCCDRRFLAGVVVDMRLADDLAGAGFLFAMVSPLMDCINCFT